MPVRVDIAQVSWEELSISRRNWSNIEVLHRPLPAIPMRSFRLLSFPSFACLLLSLLFTGPRWAGADDPATVDFARDVVPILRQHCFACHGPDQQDGQLRLDARDAVRRGGVSGKTIVAGKPQDSLLLTRVAGDSVGDRMPLDKDPLTDQQIATLRRWIESGAAWPAGVGAEVKATKPHWAYLPPRRTRLTPTDILPGQQNELDVHITRKLGEHNLSLSPRAERARLLRRLYLDLLGIPPSIASVDQFLDDKRPDAFDRQVDRLLTSPHFALKWARQWLDGARYADSNGYQADQYRNVWPYRDWVIDAMNADMPFDRFTTEQLAGDLMPNATLQQRIATGFHRLTTCNVEAGVDPEENRTNQIIDRVNTTGTVWLGTTLECAQCHSHKYDPFSQREYYQLFDYFNNTPLEVEGNGVTYNFTGPKLPLPLTPAQQQQRAQLQTQIDRWQKTIDECTLALKGQQAAWERNALELQRQAPVWHVLEIDSFASQGGASHQILEDSSILVSGKSPDVDTYTITARTAVRSITAFRLEALTHPSLPGQGPGRHAKERPNFVLHEFHITTKSPTEKQPQAVSLRDATADFSQARFGVAQAIDGKPNTAWAIAPQFHKPHTATFLTTTPLEIGPATEIAFRLDQHHGQGRTIGRLRLSVMTGTPQQQKLPAKIVKILQQPAGKRTPPQRQKLQEFYLGQDAKLQQHRAQLGKLVQQRDAIQPITTLVMVEATKQRETRVFRRGNFLDPGDAVVAGTPRILPNTSTERTGDRLELARWLVDKSNPLTARVAVNRWWAEIFGAGIVTTTEDLGTQGEPPTHPQLLDWLALELQEREWSMKEALRLIVNSATYQQSSRVTATLLAEDPYNQWLSRAPRRRLAAETIRDNALTAAGLLSSKMQGPPIYPPQPAGHWRHVGRNEPQYATSQGTDRFRRGIYVIWRRSAPYPSFTNFDAPDRAACTVKRARTNTPLQALTLLNDPVYLEMATALARRMASTLEHNTIAQKARYGFRLCLSREPTRAENQLLEQVFRDELGRFQQDPSRARRLLGEQSTEDVAPEELAAWLYVANVLLNLDEMISKG